MEMGRAKRKKETGRELEDVEEHDNENGRRKRRRRIETRKERKNKEWRERIKNGV